MTRKNIKIRVPASTSNIGPGFDSLGLTLSLYLTVDASIPLDPPPAANEPVRVTYDGDSAATVPLEPERNLVTKTALFVAHTYSTTLPPGMLVEIHNPIPLGRGLGSSGAAVVAGTLLANAACDLDLPPERLLDFCLLEEGHPDNVTASLMGGFVAGYLRKDLEEILKQDLDTKVANEYEAELAAANGSSVLRPPSPRPVAHIKAELRVPVCIGSYLPLPVNPAIRAVTVVPDFEVQTKLARSVLPPHYTRPDVVFNLQRLAILTHALGRDHLDPVLISECMQDKVHQMYRQHLVPGLPQILQLTPQNCPGLLGICVSGAGPTVLALADRNFEEIGALVKGIWDKETTGDGHPIESKVWILDIVKDAAVCETAIA
ncbi:homoserine kinase [Hyaloraphidium curvatum]|nr:homoserine kinase [Hyaloraphidium curvatum]